MSTPDKAPNGFASYAQLKAWTDAAGPEFSDDELTAIYDEAVDTLDPVTTRLVARLRLANDLIDRQFAALAKRPTPMVAPRPRV